MIPNLCRVLSTSGAQLQPSSSISSVAQRCQTSSFHYGTLEFSGLCFYSVEPITLQKGPGGDSSLWITADGPIPDEQLQISGTVSGNLPSDAFTHYLYSSSTNSFIVIAATGVRFSWAHP
jgi:hypothetical protein